MKKIILLLSTMALVSPVSLTLINDNEKNISLTSLTKKDNRNAIISSELYSNEKKYINSGCTGPKGIIQTTSDKKISYISNDGIILWRTDKTYGQNSNEVMQSSVYANGNFYVSYSSGLEVFIDIYREGDGQLINTIRMSTVIGSFSYGGYNLYNVKNTDKYIIYVARSSNSKIDTRIKIIDTNKNSVIYSFENVDGNSYDSIYSFTAEFIDNRIYFGYITQGKYGDRIAKLKFSSYDIISNNLITIKSFNIKVPFIDWPYVANICNNMYMNIKFDKTLINVFITFVYGDSSGNRTIYNYEFTNASDNLNINSIDFSRNGLYTNVNDIKIIDEYIYVWSQVSWYSDSPSIYRIPANKIISSDIKNQVSSSNLNGKDISILDVPNPLSICIFLPFEKEGLECIDGATNSILFINSNDLLPKPSETNKDQNSNIWLYVGIGIGATVLIIIMIVIIILLNKKKKEKAKKKNKAKLSPNNSQSKLLMNSSVGLHPTNNQKINAQQKGKQSPGQPINRVQQPGTPAIPQRPGQPINRMQQPGMPATPQRPGQPMRPGAQPSTQPARPTPPPPITMNQGNKSMAPKMKLD